MDQTRAIRHTLRALLDQALTAAEPGALVRESLSAAPISAQRTRLLAIGKAARAMAQAALTELAAQGQHVAEALVITNAGNDAPLKGARVRVAGHPLPDAGGLIAAREAEAIARRADTGEVLLVLISGGGSAMLPAPVPGISLQDKVQATRIALEGGLDITQINALRQHLSRLKGGGLAGKAAPAHVVALILSDVIGDDLRVVASGPTLAPIMARQEVARMLRAHRLWDGMPAPVRDLLMRPAPRAAVARAAENRLIGSNALMLERLAAQGGAVIWSRALTGDVGQAARFLAEHMRAAQPGPVLAICGGETTVRLRGAGQGGRNQELALRVAATLHDHPIARPWAVLSAGSDGRDGPTDAAGGLVDAGTLTRIEQAGGNWRALLAENDSHRALALAGDLVITGPTGTNLADIQLIALA